MSGFIKLFQFAINNVTKDNLPELIADYDAQVVKKYTYRKKEFKEKHYKEIADRAKRLVT